MTNAEIIDGLVAILIADCRMVKPKWHHYIVRACCMRDAEGQFVTPALAVWGQAVPSDPLKRHRRRDPHRTARCDELDMLRVPHDRDLLVLIAREFRQCAEAADAPAI